MMGLDQSIHVIIIQSCTFNKTFKLQPLFNYFTKLLDYTFVWSSYRWPSPWCLTHKKKKKRFQWIKTSQIYWIQNCQFWSIFLLSFQYFSFALNGNIVVRSMPPESTPPKYIWAKFQIVKIWIFSRWNLWLKFE